MQPSYYMYCGVLVLFAAAFVQEHREKKHARLADKRRRESVWEQEWLNANDSSVGSMDDAGSIGDRNIPASETTTGNGLAKSDTVDNAG